MPVMKQLNLGGTTYDTVGEASVTRVVTSGTKIATITIDGASSDLYAPSGSSVDPATSAPQMDGTAAVGSSAKYAREDHVHPTDTSRQATLVSGTNIKTVNNESLLGSGNITIDGGTALTTQEVEDAVEAAFPAVVSISFTNPVHSSEFTYIRIRLNGTQVDEVTSATGATSIEIPTLPATISIRIKSSGESVATGQSTCTGGVTFTETDEGINPNFINYTVSGSGTIVVDGVDYDAV